ncbi:60S ribosomal subunit assembly or modification protein, partial [Spiromyces aspiralis]
MSVLRVEPVYSVSFHPNDNIVVSGGGDDKAYVWRSDTGEQLFKLESHSDSVAAVKFSTDGSLVATGGMDGKINVYHTSTGEKCASLDGPDEVIWIDWHPKGPALLAGANDGTLWMWK